MKVLKLALLLMVAGNLYAMENSSVTSSASCECGYKFFTYKLGNMSITQMCDDHGTPIDYWGRVGQPNMPDILLDNVTAQSKFQELIQLVNAEKELARKKAALLRD